MLWEYLNIGNKNPVAANVDVVVVTGCHDERVAYFGAELALRNVAPILVVTGGHGRLTSNTLAISEATWFRDIALKLGVPRHRILVESEASNTGQNIVLTRRMLAALELTPASGVVVTHPYKKRRVLATAQHQWPEVVWYIDGPALSFEDYVTDDVVDQQMVELLVGEVDRLLLYPGMGHIQPQDLPPFLLASFNSLCGMGLTRHRVNG